MQSAPDLQAALNRIRAWAKANDLKPATLAREADIAENVTRNIDAPDWSPTSKSIRALESLIPKNWRAGDPVPGRQRKVAA